MINCLHKISCAYLRWEKPKTAKDVVLIALKALSYLTILLPLAAFALTKLCQKKIAPTHTNQASEKTKFYFPLFLQLNIPETTFPSNLGITDLSKNMNHSMEYVTVPEGPMLFLKLKIRFQKIDEAAQRSIEHTYQLPSTENEQELKICVHPDLPGNPRLLRIVAPQILTNHRGQVFTLNQVVNSFSDNSEELHPEREVQQDFNLKWLLYRLVNKQPVQLIEQTSPIENFKDVKGIWHVKLA